MARIFIDMDGVICDFDKSFTSLKNEGEKYPQKKESFWTGLEPMPGALEAIQQLRAAGHEVFIATAPSKKNPCCYSGKRIWIGEHIGMWLVKNLFIITDKSLIIGDVLIDDNDSTHNQKDFQGHFIHHKDWATTMVNLKNFLNSN